eukprot:TRINITY_DN1386_c0_g1_i3.p1 TRINITY_DN1386_c0_g1~~TRINITY_DN1386_c0_g1_i3.p1  ORF type:complete len:945 (+),score=95.46 TRINITY_DN1386_c0_g1_i3:73-2835(+)
MDGEVSFLCSQGEWQAATACRELPQQYDCPGSRNAIIRLNGVAYEDALSLPDAFEGEALEKPCAFGNRISGTFTMVCIGDMWRLHTENCSKLPVGDCIATTIVVTANLSGVQKQGTVMLPKSQNGRTRQKFCPFSETSDALATFRCEHSKWSAVDIDACSTEKEFACSATTVMPVFNGQEQDDFDRLPDGYDGAIVNKPCSFGNMSEGNISYLCHESDWILLTTSCHSVSAPACAEDNYTVIITLSGESRDMRFRLPSAAMGATRVKQCKLGDTSEVVKFICSKSGWQLQTQSCVHTPSFDCPWTNMTTYLDDTIPNDEEIDLPPAMHGELHTVPCSFGKATQGYLTYNCSGGQWRAMANHTCSIPMDCRETEYTYSLNTMTAELHMTTTLAEANNGAVSKVPCAFDEDTLEGNVTFKCKGKNWTVAESTCTIAESDCRHTTFDVNTTVDGKTYTMQAALPSAFDGSERIEPCDFEGATFAGNVTFRCEKASGWKIMANGTACNLLKEDRPQGDCKSMEYTLTLEHLNHSHNTTYLLGDAHDGDEKTFDCSFDNMTGGKAFFQCKGNHWQLRHQTCSEENEHDCSGMVLAMKLDFAGEEETEPITLPDASDGMTHVADCGFGNKTKGKAYFKCQGKEWHLTSNTCLDGIGCTSETFDINMKYSDQEDTVSVSLPDAYDGNVHVADCGFRNLTRGKAHFDCQGGTWNLTSNTCLEVSGCRGQVFDINLKYGEEEDKHSIALPDASDGKKHVADCGFRNLTRGKAYFDCQGGTWNLTSNTCLEVSGCRGQVFDINMKYNDQEDKDSVTLPDASDGKKHVADCGFRNLTRGKANFECHGSTWTLTSNTCFGCVAQVYNINIEFKKEIDKNAIKLPGGSGGDVHVADCGFRDKTKGKAYFQCGGKTWKLTSNTCLQKVEVDASQ